MCLARDVDVHFRGNAPAATGGRERAVATTLTSYREGRGKAIFFLKTSAADTDYAQTVDGRPVYDGRHHYIDNLPGQVVPTCRGVLPERTPCSGVGRAQAAARGGGGGGVR